VPPSYFSDYRPCVVRGSLAAVPDHAPYVRAWQSRWKQQREADAVAARRARVVARRLAGILARSYGAKRVVLCGSLARGEFRQGSDIDLAAEGIPNAKFFIAGAHVAREAGEFEVDLVPLESATAAYRRQVEEEGVLLHGPGRA
jgi:predicted nucleotidyltransferase